MEELRVGLRFSCCAVFSVLNVQVSSQGSELGWNGLGTSMWRMRMLYDGMGIR